MKSFDEFHKCNQRKDGYKGSCKSCRNDEKQKYGKKNKKLLREKAREYRLNHPNSNKKYYENNIEYFEKYRKDNEHRYKKWREDNRLRLLKYRKERMKTDIEFRLCCRIRSSISTKIRRLSRGKKCDSTVNLLGCSISDLKKHLESKFCVGMTWENYGKWHIDHIRPCGSFNLTKESEQRICFHFSNLQPLWAMDNLKKNDSYGCSNQE